VKHKERVTDATEDTKRKNEMRQHDGGALLTSGHFLTTGKGEVNRNKAMERTGGVRSLPVPSNRDKKALPSRNEPDVSPIILDTQL
jgi:hypothetical protein